MRVASTGTAAEPSADGGRATDRAFDRDAAERVLRRAVALADGPDAENELPGPRFTEQVLRDAAAEIGLDGTAVARAAAEERLGILGVEHPWSDRLVGPSDLVAVRVAEGQRDDVLARVDAWLRRVGAFQRRRHSSAFADYSRRSDPLAKAQRAVWTLTGREGLAGVRHLRVLAEPIDDNTTLIAFVVDTQLQRTVALGGAGSVVAAGPIATAIASGSVWWTSLGLAGSLLSGMGIVSARRGVVGDLTVSLDGALRSAVRPSRVTTPGRARRAS